MSESEKNTRSEEEILQQPPTVEFPTQLFHSFGNAKEVQPALCMRMRMLYLSLTQLAQLSAPDLALTHRLSVSFMQIALDEQVALPAWLGEQFCRYCRCFLVPGKTCAVRLRQRTRRSKINRDKNTKPKVKNEVLMRCLRCEKIAFRAPGYSRQKVPRVKKALSLSAVTTPATTPGKPRGAEGQLGESASAKKSISFSFSANMSGKEKEKGAPSLSKSNSSTNIASSSQKGFSFLNTLSSSASKAKKPAASLAAKPTSSLSSSLDFIPLASLAPSLSTQRMHGLAAHAPEKKLDLLALEKQNKKNKKRKSLD